MAAPNTGNIAGLYVRRGFTDTSDVTVFGAAGVPTTDADGDGVPELDGPQEEAQYLWVTTRLDEAVSGNLWQKVCVVNATRDGSRDEIDMSDRCSGNAKTFVPGQSEMSIDFEVFAKRIPSLPEWFSILENADTYGGVITCLMLDDDRSKEGARGVIGNFGVFNFTESQNLNEGIQYSITLKPHGGVSYDPPVRRVARVDPSPGP